MSKKITGWMRADIDMHPMSLALSATIRANAQPDDVAATLIIHNGQPEQVWTETEVKALVQDLDLANNDPAQFVKRIQGWGIDTWKEVARQKVFMKHGINLNS